MKLSALINAIKSKSISDYFLLFGVFSKAFLSFLLFKAFKWKAKHRIPTYFTLIIQHDLLCCWTDWSFVYRKTFLGAQPKSHLSFACKSAFADLQGKKRSYLQGLPQSYEKNTCKTPLK